MTFFKKFLAFNSKDTTSHDLTSLAFLQSPVATVVTDEKGTIYNVNSSFTELMGYTQRDSIGENMSILKSGEYNHSFYKTLYAELVNLNKYTIEIKNRCKDGTIRLFNECIVAIQSANKKYYVVTFEDITEQRKLSQRYQYLATHDPLTGLANRTLLQDRFDHALLNATRSGKKIAVIMCDLNEFKELNDTYGHGIGDITLQKVANKLQACVRAGDTISRYGGDEFVIILEQIKEVKEVENIINLLKMEFPYAFKINSETYEVGMSIGYSCFPEGGTTFEQLTSQADMKMYREKDLYYGVI